jgi:hypothetical protein
MIHYLGLISGLLLALMLGNTILSLIDRERRLAWPEYLALSFLAGVGATSLMVFLSFFWAIPGRVFVLGALILLAFAVRFIWADERQRYWPIKPIKLPEIKWSVRTLIWLFLFLILTLTFAYAFIETASKPEYSWDTCGHWTAPAVKLFYFEKTSPQNTFKLLFECVGHPYYPKQLAGMHYWLFGWMGQVDDQWSKIFFPLALLCFTVIFYSSVKRIKEPVEALLYTLVLLSSPFIVYLATIGYADLSDGIYFSTGIFFFYRWVRERADVYFWLFALFVALTTWIKLEGKPLYLLGLAVLCFYLWKDHQGALKEKLIKIGQYLSVYAMVGLPWQLFVTLNNTQTTERLANYLSHAGEMQRGVYEMLFLQGTWGLIPFLFTATVVLFWQRALTKENSYLIIILLLFCGFVFFLYMFTFDTFFMLESGFNRHWIIIYPVMVFALACIAPPLKEFLGGRDGR